MPGITFDIFAKDKGVNAAFDKITKSVDATKDAMARVAKANDDASSASARLRKAQAAELDAVGKVRVATAKLNDVQGDAKAKSGQVTAAQEALATAQRKAADAADQVTAAIKRTAATQSEAKSAAKQLAEAQSSAFDKVAKKANETATKVGAAGKESGQKFTTGFEEKLPGLASKIGGFFKTGLGAAVGLAAGAVVGAGFASAFGEALAQGDTQAKLTAQLGLSEVDAAKAGKIAGDLYTANYGESLGGVNDAIKLVIQNTGVSLNSLDLKPVTAKVLDLASVFDQDLGAVTRGVGNLMRNHLAKNAGEALDIITRGFQTGVDKSEDFLDTLNEYGPQFRKFGIDGKTATGLLRQGLQGGARDADTVADAIKEFAIRAVDGSKTTAQGFKDLGLDAKKMQDQIAKGGKPAADGLQLVLDRLRNMKDPVAQSRAAVELFGTKAEDLGTALFALDPKHAVDALGQVAGAAGKMDQAVGTTPAAAISSFFRTIKQSATNNLGGVILAFSNSKTSAKGFQGVIETVAVGVRKGFDKFKEVGTQLFTDAKGWAGQLASGLTTGIKTGNWAPLGTAIGNALIAALQGATDLTDKIATVLGNLLDKIDWKKLGPKAAGWFNSMMDSVDWPGVGKHLGDLFIHMVATTQELTTKTTKAFTDLVDSIDWSEVGTHIATGVKGSISGIDWGSVVGDSLSLGFKTSIQGGPGGLLRTFMAGISHAVVGVVKGIISAGISAIGSWLGEKIPELMHWIGQQFEKYWDWVKEPPAQHGREFSHGLLKGILDGLGDIGKWVWNNIAWPFIKWVASFWGIGSPSTVFAKIGGWLVAGLYQGILDGISGVGNWLYNNVIVPVLKPFYNNPLSWLRQKGSDVITGLKNGIVAVGKSIGSWAYNNIILPLVRPFANSPLTWLAGKGSDVITGFKNGAAAVASGIGTWAYNNVILPVVKPFHNSPGSWLLQAGKDVLDGFGAGMRSVWANVVKWVGGIANWIKTHKGPVSLDAKLLIPAGRAIMQGFLTGLQSGAGKAWDFVTSVGGKAKNAVAEAYGWIKNVGWPSISDLGSVPNATGMAKLVQTIAASRGWGSGDQWAALYKLVMGESGFRSNAQNPSSTAYGLFQFLDSTWSTVGAHKTSDPTQQTIAGLNYIQRNYGSPAQAYAAWSGRSPHWYEKGTPWVPNDQMAFLHKGEAVLPREMNHKVRTARPAAQAVSLMVESGGSRMDDLLAELIRRYVRVNGGNVQAVLGQARGA